MVYDLDSLPPDDRNALFESLAACSDDQVAAIHSYNLDNELTSVLHHRRVKVHRRLEAIFAVLPGRLAIAEPQVEQTNSSLSTMYVAAEA